MRSFQPGQSLLHREPQHQKKSGSPYFKPKHAPHTLGASGVPLQVRPLGTSYNPAYAPLQHSQFLAPQQYIQPIQQVPLQYSQRPLQYSQAPVFLGQSQQLLPPAQAPVVLGQSRFAAPMASSLVQQQQPLSSSQVVNSQVLQSGPVIQGERTVEYVAYEVPYVEQVEVERVEYVPIEKRYTDYYAIENQVEYVPVTTYETIQEMVPQQRTNYVAQTRVNYVPQVKTEYLTTSRVQETTEYVAQEKHVVKYPEFEGQFISEANASRRIPHVSAGIVQSNFEAPAQGNTSSQHVQFGGSPTLKSPASLQEKYLLKKLEKDIRRLEAETKVERSQSASPNKKAKPVEENHEEELQREAELLEGKRELLEGDNQI